MTVSTSTARTTANVAEGPMRRISVDKNINVAALRAPSPKNIAFAKPPTTASLKVDDAALAPTRLSGSGRKLRQDPYRSSLVDCDDEPNFMEFEIAPRLMWSSQLLDASVLPVLPSVNHPLEKSSVIVKDISPCTIATRIQRVLQRRSIAASYPSPHKAHCMSSTQVEFCIFLYRQNSDQDGIIVEVQRRDGFDVSYMADVYAILDAASGKEQQQNEVSSWPMYFEDNNNEEVNSDKEGRQVPMILSQTFKKDKEPTVEEVSLCLSSLASLTNQDKVGNTATQVSRQFLLSDECKELRYKVFSLIDSKTDTSRFSSKSTIQALEVLSNVCNCTRGSAELLEPILSANELELPRHLLDHIENASSNPQAATYACIVFKRLVEEQTITNVTSMRLTAALINAVSLGGEIHAGLERHAGRCLSLMST
jgi:hypothetical protein